MTLHLIADDLRDHAWYEQLFVPPTDYRYPFLGPEGDES